MRIGSRRGLPEGPVAMLSPRKWGLLEAALLLSFLVHVVVLLALYAWQDPETEAATIVGTRVERVVIETGRLGRFREQRVTPAPVARPVPSAVAQVTAPAVVLQTIPVARPKPAVTTPPKMRVVDVEPPPVPRWATPDAARAAVATHPSPSPSAPPLPVDPEGTANASPTPSPTPAPAVAVASPVPQGAGDEGAGDAPLPSEATGPSPAPAAQPSGVPSPSTEATARGAGQSVAQDARADFTLIVGYQNDTRIPRDRQGFLVLDLEKLCNLAQVKPILTEVPHGVIPLKQASVFGLRPLSRAQARVRVAVELPGLPMPVQPQDVVISEVTVDGARVDGDTLEKLSGFIRAQVTASRWLPASDKGAWKSRSEEDFTVEVVQAVASPVAEGNSPSSPPR